MNQIFRLWLNPKAAVQQHAHPTWLSTLFISLILTVAYFSCFGLLLLFINHFPEKDDLISPLAFWLFFIVFGAVFTLLNISSLMIFFLTKWVHEGSLAETKAAVHCAALSTIPIAFFAATFIGNEVFGSFSLFCIISSLLLILAFSTYSFYILVLTLVKIHQMKVLKAFYITILGVIATALISVIFIQLLRNFI